MGNLPDANWEWRRKGAYGVYNCLKKHKIAVPEEISLVGYDDIFFSEILDVPLTTVSQPVYDMGVEAVHQLISEIGSGVNSQKCITFQPRLVVRESTVEHSELNMLDNCVIYRI